MADLKDKIEKARQAGYSDSEIKGFLSEKIKTARGAGYSDKEIDEYLAGYGLSTQPPQWQQTNANEYNQSLPRPLDLRLKQAVSQPGTTLGKAVRQFGEGNVGAGALNTINALGQAAFLPVTTTAEYLKSVPVVGEPLVGALELPSRAINAGTAGITSVLNAISPSNKTVSNITGISEKALDETGQAMGETNQMLAQILTPMVAPKVAGAVGKSTRAGLERTAGKLEAYAQKPKYDTKKGINQFDRQIATTLRENANPTRGGLKKINNILDELDNTSTPIRDNATNNGATVNFNGFQKYLENQKQTFTKDANYGEKIAAIEDIQSRVSRMSAQYPDGKVPLNDAWRFKQTLQDMVGNKYDEVSTYSKEAAKDAAHALLDDIVYKYPELKEIGLRQRDLIEAQGMISKRVADTQSRSIIPSLSARRFGAGMLGGYYGGIPGAVAGYFGEALLESPVAHHKVAVAFDRLSKLGKGKQNPYRGYKAKPFPETETIYGTNPSDWKDPMQRSQSGSVVDNTKVLESGIKMLPTPNNRLQRR